MIQEDKLNQLTKTAFMVCTNYSCKNYDNCKQSKKGDFVPKNVRWGNKVDGKLNTPVLLCDDYELQCNYCQGCGCAVCGGSGFITQ